MSFPTPLLKKILFPLDIFLFTCDMMTSVIAMGCRQVVRHLVLVQTFRGSNPCTPVKISLKIV